MGAPAAGQHLLHHSVIPVLRFGLDRLERRVGEHGVVAPAGEQFVLPFGGLVWFRLRTRRTISRAVISWPLRE
jgi:hypothetical protein